MKVFVHGQNYKTPKSKTVHRISSYRETLCGVGLDYVVGEQTNEPVTCKRCLKTMNK